MHKIEVYEQATLTANRLSDSRQDMTGALYSSTGQLVNLSLRSVSREDNHIPVDPTFRRTESLVVGSYQIQSGYDMYIEEAILAGHVFAGWGHNITETISTAWASYDVDPQIPLLLIPWGRLWVSALPRIRELLSLAGWDQRPILMATGSAVLGRIHVPERLVRFDELLHDRLPIPSHMNSVYDRMIKRSVSPADPSDKRPALLSRPRNHRRIHPHEIALEFALRDLDYQIIEGWNLSVKDQISLVNSSTALVAFSGSSLHNSVFAGSGVPVVEILDERSSMEDAFHLQPALCELRQQKFTSVEGYSQGAPRSLQTILREVIELTSFTSG